MPNDIYVDLASLDRAEPVSVPFTDYLWKFTALSARAISPWF